jgi:peptidoglycan/LPS O-acetylase OafA/YrhL
VPGEILLVADFLMLGGCVLALHRGWPHRLLGWRPLAGIGVVSYSLYVWHVPILNAIVGRSAFARDYRLLLLVGGALSIAAAVASYAVIERPFLRRRQAWTATIAVARATARGPMPSTE